jgi:hypothetical protein
MAKPHSLILTAGKMRQKSTFVKVALLLLIPLFAYQIPHANAAPQLSVGDWWSVQGNDQTSALGTGTMAGSFLEKENYTVRFVVTDMSNDTITVLQHSDSTFVCNASDQWSCSNSKGSYSVDRQYTIALSNLVLTKLTVNGNSSTSRVGYHTWIMQDPSLLATSKTATYLWCIPHSDDTTCSDSDVQATVSTTQVILKGVSEKGYVLTYSGPALGQFNNGRGVWSLGTGTDMPQYDSMYGIWTGGTYNAAAKGIGTGGNWTDGYVEHDYFNDSSLTFTPANVTTASSMTSTSTTSSSVGNPLTSIPGFPIESIILGVILAFVVLIVKRSKTVGN